MIGSAEGSQQEGREYGSISYNVYWQYLKAGGLTLLAMFIGLSVSLQTLKVYLDYLLRWSSTLNPWFNFIQTFRDLVGSPNAGDVSSFFHIFGSLSFVVILVTYFYNILGQVAKKNLVIFQDRCCSKYSLFSVDRGECSREPSREDASQSLPLSD